MFNQHPKGLYTLFFTEMWERMSYYGMRGILVLFMTASILEGGLQFDNVSASAIYGIYSACVYLVACLFYRRSLAVMMLRGGEKCHQQQQMQLFRVLVPPL